MLTTGVFGVYSKQASPRPLFHLPKEQKSKLLVCIHNMLKLGRKYPTSGITLFRENLHFKEYHVPINYQNLGVT